MSNHEIIRFQSCQVDDVEDLDLANQSLPEPEIEHKKTNRPQLSVQTRFASLTPPLTASQNAKGQGVLRESSMKSYITYDKSSPLPKAVQLRQQIQ